MKILLQTILSSLGLVKNKTIQLVLSILLGLLTVSYCYESYIDQQIKLIQANSPATLQQNTE